MLRNDAHVNKFTVYHWPVVNHSQYDLLGSISLYFISVTLHISILAVTRMYSSPVNASHCALCPYKLRQ